MPDVRVWAKNFPNTLRLYLDYPYLKSCIAKVLGVLREKSSRYYFTLDKTIFHPKGGGQPSDVGIIKINDVILDVKKVLDVNDVIIHYVKVKEGSLITDKLVGNTVYCEIDWNQRYKVMRLHTAGHILDYAVQKVYGDIVNTLDAFHGPPEAYVGYEAEPPSSNMVKEIERIANEIVRKGKKVSYVYVTRDKLQDVIFNAPNINRLPKSRIYRVVIIEDVNGIPCTGTHVRNTKEVGSIEITKVEANNRMFRLYYNVK